jgi:hypothetical protein
MNTLKKFLLGGLLSAAVAVPLLTPAPAQAWWHGGGWGWHGGFGWHAGWHPGFYRPGWGWGGWRGGVYVGAPAVTVGYPYAYGYAPYWVPGYYGAGGVFIAGHWGYRR